MNLASRRFAADLRRVEFLFTTSAPGPSPDSCNEAPTPALCAGSASDPAPPSFRRKGAGRMLPRRFFHARLFEFVLLAAPRLVAVARSVLPASRFPRSLPTPMPAGAGNPPALPRCSPEVAYSRTSPGTPQAGIPGPLARGSNRRTPLQPAPPRRLGVRPNRTAARKNARCNHLRHSRAGQSAARGASWSRTSNPEWRARHPVGVAEHEFAPFRLERLHHLARLGRRERVEPACRDLRVAPRAARDGVVAHHQVEVVAHHRVREQVDGEARHQQTSRRGRAGDDRGVEVAAT